MICETCRGSGLDPRYWNIMVVDGAKVAMGQQVPCPTCGGCGVDHCCGGDGSQQEVHDADSIN